MLVVQKSNFGLKSNFGQLNKSLKLETLTVTMKMHAEGTGVKLEGVPTTIL